MSCGKSQLQNKDKASPTELYNFSCKDDSKSKGEKTMTTYKLEVTVHEPDDYIYTLYGYVSLAKNDAFCALEKKLLESGEADEYFDNYMEKPYPKLWKEPKMVSADYAVEEWFNDSYDVASDRSFARSFYNSTIHKSDIEVTFDRDYYVELDGDTFVAHVQDTWDELYKNAEAIRLLKENDKLGQKYVDMYLSDDASKEFKQAFERIFIDDYGVDLESLADSDDFQSNLVDLTSELDISWKAEASLDELYSASLERYNESLKRTNAAQGNVSLTAQYKQIEDFMKILLKELPEDEQSKVDEQIYYDTRKNSVQFMLTVNESSPHFFAYYDKNKGAKTDVGAAQCWIKNGYLSGAVYHDGDFEPFAQHYRKFDGDLGHFVRSLIDTCGLTKLPQQEK